jgi:nucleoid DNA-binding protein
MNNKIAKQSRVQSILLRRANIEEQDVMLIWEALSLYIRGELSKKVGVIVPGFGTFTYVETHLDIGNNKEIVKLRPAFILSDKFSKKHSLEHEKEFINESIPVKMINYVTIRQMAKSKYSREIIELVLNEAFTAMDHFIRIDCNISIPFNGLGIFRIMDVNPKPKRVARFEFSSAMTNHMPIM